MITFIVIIIIVINIIVTIIMIIIISITIIIIAIALNIIFIVINNSAETVHCFYKVSCRFAFASISFLISLNRIHATSTWC